MIACLLHSANDICRCLSSSSSVAVTRRHGGGGARVGGDPRCCNEEVLHALAGYVARTVLDEGVEEVSVVGDLVAAAGGDRCEGAGGTARGRCAGD